MGNKQIKKLYEEKILTFEVLLVIIDYIGYQKEIIYFTNLSKSLRQEIRNQNYWKNLYQQSFIYNPPKLKVKDWFQHFLSRKIATNKDKQQIVPIEELITWEFKCPILSDQMERTKDLSIDFCPVCKKSVYLTSTKEELEKNISLDRCIIWDPTKRILQNRRIMRVIEEFDRKNKITNSLQ